MLVGKKGVKYGLQLPAKPAPKQVRKPQAAISAFQEGSDDDETIGQQIARQQAKISSDVKVANLHAKALEEDPSIFDYDSHFDAMQEKKVRPAMQEKIERKSRYIEALKDKAVQREREQNVVYERKLAKERSAEDHLFGDKEKFVTAAYKRKLEEEKQWLAEEKLREAEERKNDVVKKGHMGDFYRNILKTNDVRTGLKKPEQESKKRAAPNDAMQASTSLDLTEAAAPSESETDATEPSHRQTAAAAPSQRQSSAIEGEAAPASASDEASAAPADWDIAKAARDRHTTQASRTEAGTTAAHQEAKAAAAPDDPDGPDAAEQIAAPGHAVDAEIPAQISKEDKIAAAREKYLARKRQKTAR